MGLSKRDRKRLMKDATRNAINILAKAGNPVDGAPPLEFTLNGVLRIECSEIQEFPSGERMRTIVIHAEGYPAGAVRLNVLAAGVEELRLKDPQPGCDAAMAIGRACGWKEQARFERFNPWKYTTQYEKGQSYDVEDPTGRYF